jgi:geranylgeranyl pyrophosphate synthase
MYKDRSDSDPTTFLTAALQPPADGRKPSQAFKTAEELIQNGKDNLDVLPDNEARDLLEGIADFLIEREY